MCRLVVLLAQCRTMVFLTYCERFLCTRASSNDVAAPNAHSIRGIATSSAFFRNWSLASVLEASSWRSNTVFTSFYLTDV